MPQPKRINSRKVWDRWAIDAAFDSLPDVTEVDPEQVYHNWKAGRDQEEHDFYVKSLGYDPRGMTDAEKEAAEAHQQEMWKGAIKREPLNKRERLALRGLLRHGREWSSTSSVKGASIGTLDRLVARGFVETKNYQHNTWQEWRLSESGLAHADALGTE